MVIMSPSRTSPLPATPPSQDETSQGGRVGIGNMGGTRPLLSLLRDAELVGVADPMRRGLPPNSWLPLVADYNDLIAEVEAVCIAVPTRHHPVGMLPKAGCMC